METSLIEQMDKMRFSFMTWATIGWGIWFGTYIVTDLTQAPLVLNSVPWIRLLGWLVLIVSTIRFMKLKRELNWDRKMKKALEGELHQYNKMKSFQMGYIVVIGITLICFVLTTYTTISALLVTKLILYFGVLAVTVSKLIYNRD